MRTLTHWIVVVGLAALVGCGNDSNNAKAGNGSTTSCEIGTERCDCYRNGTCDSGLTCASGLCVKLATGSNVAGSPSVGGSASSPGGSAIATALGGTSAAAGAMVSVPQGGASLTAGGTVSILHGGTSSVAGASSTNPAQTLTPTQVDAINNATCSVWDTVGHLTPPKLQLVVDVSSSMGSSAPGSTSTKWEVLREALVEAIVGVTGPGLAVDASVGLLFYPNMVNESVSRTPVATSVCVNTLGATPMAKLGINATGTHRTTLRTALTAALLGRGTPTADAFGYALNNIALASEQLAVPGDTNMLLITDGAPTLYQGCYNPTGTLSNLPADELVALTDGAYKSGIKTYIVGLPGSESALAGLSMAAYRGGTAGGTCSPDSSLRPCHMDLTTAPDMGAALRAALSQVTASLSGCRVDIPSFLADTNQIADATRMAPLIQYGNGTNVLLGQVTMTGSECSDGYTLVGSSAIELCTNTCAMLHADSAASIQLIFGCSAEELRAVGVN